MELQHPAALDRVVDGADHLGVVPSRRDLEALLRGVVTQRGDDLLARRRQAGLRQMVAEQVDRRDQRLGLQGQQPRRPGEVLPVGVRVDLDFVAGDLGVEDVGAAAEIDHVEDVDVLAELLAAHVQLVEDRGDGEPRILAGGADQEPGQRHEPGEALGPDHRLRAAVDRPRAAVAVRDRARDGLRQREPAVVALVQELEPRRRLLGQLLGLEQRGVLPPAQHPREQEPARRVLGLVDRAAPGDAVLLGRLAE